MPVVTAPPGVWTPIPDLLTDVVLEARGTGFYVDTTGAQPAAAGEGHALPSGQSMVISAAIAAQTSIQPAQSVLPVRAFVNQI